MSDFPSDPSSPGGAGPSIPSHDDLPPDRSPAGSPRRTAAKYGIVSLAVALVLAVTVGFLLVRSNANSSESADDGQVHAPGYDAAYAMVSTIWDRWPEDKRQQLCSEWAGDAEGLASEMPESTTRAMQDLGITEAGFAEGFNDVLEARCPSADASPSAAASSSDDNTSSPVAAGPISLTAEIVVPWNCWSRSPYRTLRSTERVWLLEAGEVISTTRLIPVKTEEESCNFRAVFLAKRWGGGQVDLDLGDAGLLSLPADTFSDRTGAVSVTVSDTGGLNLEGSGDTAAANVNWCDGATPQQPIPRTRYTPVPPNALANGQFTAEWMLPGSASSEGRMEYHWSYGDDGGWDPLPRSAFEYRLDEDTGSLVVTGGLTNSAPVRFVDGACMWFLEGQIP